MTMEGNAWVCTPHTPPYRPLHAPAPALCLHSAARHWRRDLAFLRGVALHERRAAAAHTHTRKVKNGEGLGQGEAGNACAERGRGRRRCYHHLRAAFLRTRPTFNAYHRAHNGASFRAAVSVRAHAPCGARGAFITSTATTRLCALTPAARYAHTCGSATRIARRASPHTAAHTGIIMAEKE